MRKIIFTFFLFISSYCLANTYIHINDGRHQIVRPGSIEISADSVDKNDLPIIVCSITDFKGALSQEWIQWHVRVNNNTYEYLVDRKMFTTSMFSTGGKGFYHLEAYPAWILPHGSADAVYVECVTH